MVFHHFNLCLDKTPNYHLPLPSESSEKIQRTLDNNVRTSGDTKYITGDSVYFKKIYEKRWRGPGRVLGQDGQQVLVKYSSNYVRVHLCRLSLVRTAYNKLNPKVVQKSIEPSQIRDKHNIHTILESESEDKIIQQINNNNNSTIENHQEKNIQQNINTIPENSLKEIDNLSASLEKLSV